MSFIGFDGASKLEALIAGKTIPEQFTLLCENFGEFVVFSSSLGLEDQVITQSIAVSGADIKIFTLDTGRLFQETYDLIDRTTATYKVDMQVYFPNNFAVETFMTEKGANSFYESIENRKECCHIRKVEPLSRALKNAKVWITGLRKEQSTNRETMKLVEWDAARELYKFSPLINWTAEEIESYINENDIPYNPLHNKGFASIGCAPCTRAVAADEDARAGRWWWENSQKECGLHK